MTRRTINSLVALTIPEIQNLFLEQMQDVVDRALLDEMVAAIEAGDAEALFRATGYTPAVLGPMLDRIERLYREAAEVTADGFPASIRTPTGSVIFRFDMRNPLVEQELRQHSSGLVTSITEDTREVVRANLERGMIAGRNPRNTALDIVGRIDPKTKKRIGGAIGLTPRQDRWVANARRYLEQADERYFTLTLRDKRFDKTVERYIAEGKPIPTETLEKAIVSYKNRALKYRADVIARTETLGTIQRSDYQVHKQLITDGVLPASAIRKWWNAVGDRRTRPSHNVMERQTKENPIEMDEPFVSPSGARLMHPGDRTLGAPAKETIQCRCKLEYKVDWLAWGLDE